MKGLKYFMLVILLIFQTNLYAANSPTNIIIDTDMGWDDTLSILYLLKRPDINIMGITVTGCGETNLRWGKVIAKTLMELGKQKKVTICAGTETPMKFDHRFPQSFKNDMNDIMGLLGSLNPEDYLKLDPRPAWQFLSETLNSAQEDITILSLGGFTNLGKMLKMYPHTRLDKVKNIYAMAGAVFVDGNIALLNNAKKEWDQGPIYSTNHYAEWNIFVDPLATHLVLQSSLPLTLIPLDACDYVMLSPDDVESIQPKDDISRLAKKILEYKTGPHDEGIPVPIFDPLATMIMAHDLQGYEAVKSYLDIELKENKVDNKCGKIFTVKTGSRKINIVQGVSNYKFKKEFSKVMNKN